MSRFVGFIRKLLRNLNQELERSKVLQENKRLLEERLRQLSNSDVRKKYLIADVKGSEAAEEAMKQVKVVTDGLGKATQEALKHAKVVTDGLEKAAKVVGDTQAYKQLASTATNVSAELDNLAGVRMYSRPGELSMRSLSSMGPSVRFIEPNTEAQDVELHKDSKWHESWSSFTNSNPYFSKLLAWKFRFEESDNLAVLMARSLTDKVYDVIFSTNEVSDVLTEISKVDPHFNKVEWLRFCEKNVIPNIIEACIRFDLEVLNDWCLERAFNQLAVPIKECQKVGFSASDSRIIDLGKVEMISGKMMEQGPVIVISFHAYMIHVVKSEAGKIVEGDQNVPIRMRHVWVMCRDMEEYNSTMAWKLLEYHSQQDPLSI